MLTLAKVFALLGILWAASALAVQVVLARGGAGKDYSRRAGEPRRGLVYGFTVAMLPTHKETARLHPAEFALGVVMHIGVILSLIGVVLLLAWPSAACRVLPPARLLVALALAAGICLLIRRALSENLRAISAPDDYIAILATSGLLGLSSLLPIGGQGQTALLIYAGLFFTYLPLGKLRHAVFFFAARGDHARRLGYRGVYLPGSPRTE